MDDNNDGFDNLLDSINEEFSNNSECNENDQEVLSKDEVSDLLSKIAGESDVDLSNNNDIKVNAKLYDFKRPDFLTKDEFIQINNFVTDFSEFFTKNMSEKISVDIQCSVNSIDNLLFEELMRCMSFSSVIFTFNLDKNKRLFFELWKVPIKKIMEKTSSHLQTVIEEIFKEFFNRKNINSKMIGVNRTTDIILQKNLFEVVLVATLNIFIDNNRNNAYTASFSIPRSTLYQIFPQFISSSKINNEIESEITDSSVIFEIIAGKAKLDESIISRINIGSRIFFDRPPESLLLIRNKNDNTIFGRGQSILLDDFYGVRITEIESEPCKINKDINEKELILGTIILEQDQVQGIGEGSMLKLDKMCYEPFIFKLTDNLQCTGYLEVQEYLEESPGKYNFEITTEHKEQGILCFIVTECKIND